MLNNADDDYLTSMAIGLFVSNRINKKFRNMENKGGVLNGEFIKQHLKRETELENKIFELEEKIKALKGDSKDSVWFNMFMHMMSYARIEHNMEDRYVFATLSINDYPLTDEEIQFINNILTTNINKEIDDKIINKFARYGMGGSPINRSLSGPPAWLI